MSYGKRWTAEDERMLVNLYNDGMSKENMSKYIQRTVNAIKIRIQAMVYRGKLKYRSRKHTTNAMKKVRCIETGQIWESHKALAAELGYSQSAIGNHIRFRDPIKGLHYENIKA